jgi:hypothetical protein
MPQKPLCSERINIRCLTALCNNYAPRARAGWRSKVSNTSMNCAFAILAAILLFPSLSIAQTSPKSVEPQLPCAFKGDLFQVKHKAKWFTSDEMKERALEKVDVGGPLKNADVNATVIASVIVGTDGRVECLKIINPKHPLVAGEMDKALRQWKFKPMEQNRKLVSYVGWLQFQFCRIGCPEGKSFADPTRIGTMPSRHTWQKLRYTNHR